MPARPAQRQSHVFTHRNVPLGLTLPISPTMTLRNAAHSLTPALCRLAYRQARTVSPRQFSTSAHNAPKSSDTPWIVRLRHSLSLLSCPQLVFIDRVLAHLHPDGQSFDIAYVLRPQRIYKLRSRLDICCRHLHALNHIMRTVLLVMESPTLLWRTPRQCLQLHLQSRPRYATSTHLARAWVVSITRRIQNEETIADAEGTEVPAEQVKASIIQAVVRFHSSSLSSITIIENSHLS